MPKTWIPLDKDIQERMWDARIWDKDNNWWITDLETRFVYFLVRCIFDKEVFSEKYVKEIEDALGKIDMSVTERMLEKVFFKYTNRLLKMVRAGKYDEIRDDYIRFIEY